MCFRRFALVAVLGVSACSEFNPQGVLISCESNDDCPGVDRFTCKTDVGLCVANENLGGQAIELVGPVDVGAGVFSRQPGFDELGVRFELSQDVSLPPEVTLDGAAIEGCEAVAPTAEGAVAAFACARPIIEDDVEGAHEVRVVAFDEGLNRAEDAVAVRFDFSAPQVVEQLSVLQLLPGADNPLSSLSAARAGTTLRFILRVDEPPVEDPAPAVQVAGDAGAIPFTRAPALEGDDPLVLVLEGVVPEGLTDGAISFELISSDAVGNSGTVAIPLSVELDSTPPAAPDVAAAGGIVYRRVPWGSADTGAPEFTVRSEAPVVEAGVTVLFYESEAAEVVESIASVAADDTGTFEPIELSRVDRARLFTAAADGAGNTSALVEVREIEWVATLRRKVGTRRLENPHQLFTTRRFSPRLRRDQVEVVFGSGSDADEASGVDVAAPGDGRALTTLGGAAWIERTPGGDRPPTRNNPGLAFDSSRGRLVLFGGGLAGGEALADLWELDGDRWVEAQPEASPPARESPAMAYHPVLDRVFLFGGAAGATTFADTWELDRGAWAQLNPPVSPTALEAAQMVFDLARGHLLLVGGDPASQTLETWSFDGFEWAQLSTAGPTGDDFALAYDAARGQGVLIDPALSTWTWDGADWTQHIVTQPAGALTHQIAFDDARDRVVYLTGVASWEWDGADWTAGLDAPQNRDDGRLAYFDYPFLGAPGALTVDEAMPGERGGLFVVGDGAAELHYDGARWRVLNGLSPPALQQPAAAYDADEDRMVVVGRNATADAWAWDGLSWQDIANPSNASAQPIADVGAMSTDAGGRVAFVGREGTTAVLETDAWRTLTVAGTPPQVTASQAIFDGTSLIALAGNNLFRFNQGGQVNAGTWEIVVTDPKPNAGQQNHAIAYDVVNNRVVLFGGVLNCDSTECATWLFGNAWAELTGLDPRPPSRFLLSMTYDEARRRALVFGGILGAGETGGGDLLWEWDGNAWGPRLAGPDERASAAMAWDPVTGRAFLFGGQGGAALNDTWEWDGSGLGRPGQIARVGFSFAGVEAGDRPTSLRVSWDAGADGFPDDARESGAALLTWTRGRWVPRAVNAASSIAPQRLSFETSEAALLRDLFVGNELTLHLAAVPVAVNGPGGEVGGGRLDYGVVATDYLEVEVRYETGVSE